MRAVFGANLKTRRMDRRVFYIMLSRRVLREKIFSYIACRHNRAADSPAVDKVVADRMAQAEASVRIVARIEQQNLLRCVQ